MTHTQLCICRGPRVLSRFLLALGFSFRRSSFPPLSRRSSLLAELHLENQALMRITSWYYVVKIQVDLYSMCIYIYVCIYIHIIHTYKYRPHIIFIHIYVHVYYIYTVYIDRYYDYIKIYTSLYIYIYLYNCCLMFLRFGSVINQLGPTFQ